MLFVLLFLPTRHCPVSTRRHPVGSRCKTTMCDGQVHAGADRGHPQRVPHRARGRSVVRSSHTLTHSRDGGVGVCMAPPHVRMAPRDTDGESPPSPHAASIGREVLDIGGRAVRAGVTCDEIDRVVHEVDGLFCLLGCWFVLFVGLLVCWTPSTMSARSQPPTPLRPPFDHPEPNISWGRGEATSSRRLITPRGNEERDVRDASRARLSVAGTPRIPFKDASDAAFPSPARRGSRLNTRATRPRSRRCGGAGGDGAARFPSFAPGRCV